MNNQELRNKRIEAANNEWVKQDAKAIENAVIALTKLAQSCGLNVMKEVAENTAKYLEVNKPEYKF